MKADNPKKRNYPGVRKDVEEYGEEKELTQRTQRMSRAQRSQRRGNGNGARAI
jgi:hypothetical protein